MDNKILEVKNLTKKFKKFTAVDDVSFALKEGEILGFLGPNGAGKTTTIQMMLGVLTPTSGNIFYFGKNFNSHREEILEQVNFSSTYTNLPWDLKVYEALNYTSYLYSISDRKKQLDKIKKIFRLTKLWNMKISELSAGQLTRVNLAKAFINFPKIILLDEPTASMDPETARYMRNFLLEERKRFGVSILITSHNMAEIEEICDRVIFLNNGKIIADDVPEKLARTLDISHVEFLVIKNIEKMAAMCKMKNMQCRVKGKYINIDMKEDAISNFLDDIKKEGIIYDEISIQKPTLEDYFLTIAKK
jgi:ABC-2 type transport system ATP-binding protein